MTRQTAGELSREVRVADLAYAWARGLGWRLLPVRAEGKRPALRRWPELATSDVSQLGEWFLGAFSDCLVGVCTGRESGIWVLDLDRREGVDGFRVLERIEQGAGEKLVPTFTVRTPSGGEHRYFRYPEVGEMATTGGRGESSGLDSRGRGGMVLAPETRIWVEGNWRRYEIVDDREPVDAPGWLVDRFSQREKVRETADLTAVGSGACRGMAEQVLEETWQELAGQVADRNTQLNRAAFKLGTLGAHGLLAEGEARYWLVLVACRQNGLLSDDGETQCGWTFTSGWESGLEWPAPLHGALRIRTELTDEARAEQMRERWQ